MGTGIDALRRAGLTNLEVGFTNKEILDKPAVFIAWCSSVKCTGADDWGRVEKKVSRAVSDCPDCGSSLFWECRRTRGK